MVWISMSYVEVNWKANDLWGNDDLPYVALEGYASPGMGNDVRCPICKGNQFEALGHYKICVDDDCKTALVLKGKSNELRYRLLGEDDYLYE